MQARFYTIERIGSGFLAVMGRPVAGEYATEEFEALSRSGIQNVVSLLEPDETRDLQLENEYAYCSSAGIGFLSFPIPDRGTPESAEELSKLGCDIYRRCAGGGSSVIHCRAGIGRESIVAAAVLLHCGFSVDEAIELISKARGLAVPDTEEQLEWLKLNEETIRQCHLQRRGW